MTGRLERQLGYAVETRLAMAVLSAHSPEALAWWQENTPHVMQPRRYFVFHSDVGHVGGFNYLVRPATTILAGWRRGMISS